MNEKNSMHIVSIIMTARNQQNRIGRSIESILGQSFRDFEFIVIDDFSSDSTLEVIEQYCHQDPRIILIKNEAHLGIAKSVNRVFAESRGEYIARIDSDDAWIDSDKLKLQVEFLQAHQEYAAVGGGMVVVDTDGKELFRYLKPENDEHIRKTALLTNPIANSTSLCRRSAIDERLLCDETLPVNEDWDFWLRVGRRGKLYNFPLYFSYYTMTGGNHSLGNIRANSLAGIRIIRRYRKDYPNFFKGVFINCMQYMYGCTPRSIRDMVNPTVSKFKKIITGSHVRSWI